MNGKLERRYGSKKMFFFKLILVALLLLTLAFIISQKTSFVKSVVYYNDHRFEKLPTEYKENLKLHPETAKDDMERYRVSVLTESRIDMTGNVEVRQKFVAQDSRINRVKLFFNNPASYRSKGKLTVFVEDEEGNEVASAAITPDLIAHNARTRFSFNGDTIDLNIRGATNKRNNNKNSMGEPINKGQTYYLVVKGENIQSVDEPFELYIGDDVVEDGNTLTVNGEEFTGKHLYGVVEYRHFTFTVFTFFILAVLFTILLVMLPIDAIQERINRKRITRNPMARERNVSQFLLRLMFILTPAANFFMIEKISGRTTRTTVLHFFSLEGVLNLLIIGFIMWLIYMVVNRTKATIVLMTLFNYIFAVANYMLLLFRNSPLIPMDLTAWRTGVAVASTYSLSFNKAFLWTTLLSVIWICLALSLHGNKGLSWKKRIVVVLIACIWGMGLNHLFFQSSFAEDHRLKISNFRPKVGYLERGYYLAFVIMMRNSRVEKPDGYSTDAVEKIAKKYTSDPAADVGEVSQQNPNVIVVMNEAFSDLQAVGKFNTNREYMPYFNSLKEDVIKGTLHTSVFGGSTADTEFEIQTGFTMQFQPFHSVPYLSLVKYGTPSLSWNMRARGYGGNAGFHPGLPDSYNRENAYPNMGLMKSIFVTDMEDPELIRSYVSDQADFNRVEAEYEEYRKSGNTNPYYMFNVTIQNHGSYKLSEGVILPAVIAITDDSAREEEAEQYLNLIYKTDQALKQLITYFKKVKEPTIIVLFGDHQPRVGTEFYNYLYGQTEGKITLADAERKYQVPFMIWANYDIEEKDGIQLSANYLHSYLMQELGAPLTGFEKYLLELHKTLPVISDVCDIDKDGNVYDPDEENPYSDLIREYRILQYNGLVDIKNRNSKFFYLDGGVPPEQEE